MWAYSRIGGDVGYYGRDWAKTRRQWWAQLAVDVVIVAVPRGSFDGCGAGRVAAQHDLDVILNLEPWGLPPWAERDEFRVVRLDGTLADEGRALLKQLGFPFKEM